MKQLSFLLLFFIVFSRVSGQQPTLYQSNAFIFNSSNLVPAGNYIFEAAKYNEFQTGSEYNPAPGVSLEARINPYLIFPPEGGETGGSNQGDNGVVGSLSGILDVSSSGAANYSIPLDIPDGVNGMKPNLSVQYTSQGGNGFLGIGWALGGFSSISRASTDFYKDGPVVGVNGVHFNQFDLFALDGQRLIDVNNTVYGSDNAEYRTEIQSFVKVVSHGVAGNGPAWFEVWTKDGKTIKYGNTTDSRIEAPGKQDVLLWLISSITDRQGNFVSFEYNENGDMTYSPSRIIYTGNNSITPAAVPFYAVEFTYESRPDPFTNYLSGTYVNTNLRLLKIGIRYLPTAETYKEYTFTYSNEANTQINSISEFYSHLNKIGVSDGNNTHLNPTTVEWGTLPTQFESHSVLSAGSYDALTGDFNGDGKTDVIKAHYYFNNFRKVYTYWELWLANSNGTNFEMFQNAGGSGLGDGCQGFVVGDFNGDGLSDFLELMDNWWDDNPSFHNHMQLSIAKDSAGFTGFYPTQVIDGFQLPALYRYRGVQTGDFNGDGLDDIAVRCSHRANIEQYEDIYDCKVLISTFDVANNILSVSEITPNITNINRFIVGRFYDKTRNDLMVLKEGHTLIYYWNKQINNFSILTPEFGNYPSKYHTIFPTDFNGDGITDILSCVKPDNSDVLWQAIEFTGSGPNWPAVTISFLPNQLPTVEQGRYNVFPGDYNGDGKTDIMSIDSYYHRLKFYFSKGNCAFIETPETTTLDVFCVSTDQFTFNDFNGDGIADILYENSISEPRIMVLGHPHDKTELVKSFQNGLGKTDKINYCSLSTSDTNIYKKYNTTYLSSLGTVKDFQGPMYIVSSIESDNGLGAFLSKSFSYEGAHIQRLTKEFLGFSKISSVDNSTHIKTVSTYSYLVPNDGPEYPEYFYFPHVERAETYLNQTLIGQVENVYKAYQYFPAFSWNFVKRQLFFPYLVKSNSKSWDIDGSTFLKTSRTTIDYDAQSLPFGNPIGTTRLNDPSEINILSQDDQFTFKEQVTNTNYPYDETNWVIGNVEFSTTQTSIKDHGSQTKIRRFLFYPIGDFRSQLLWKEIVEPADHLGFKIIYDYYPNGNTKSQLLTAPNANPPISNRLTQYEYDPVNQSRFLTKTIDPLNHFAQAGYDLLTGELKLTTDINGFTTTFDNNIFSTEIQSKAPDGTKNVKVLRWVNGQSEAPANALFYSWEQTSGSGETFIFYDKLGRVLRTVTKGFDNASIFVDQEYDQFGRPTKTSIPYFPGETILYTESKYNTSLPRVDYKIFPDQTHLWYTYNGPVTTTTNQANQATSQKTNAIGLLEESTDANLKTVKFEYSYDGSNFITTSKIQGYDNTLTTIQVDRFGRRTKISDLSSGTLEETYNAYGELISSKSQKQTDLTKTLFTYDKLGRILTRTEDGQLTTWTYDSKPFGIGKPDKVANNDQTIEYFYDGLGRTRQTDETINGEKNEAGEKTIFSFTYTYDEFSRLKEETYPSTITIRNYYNNNGYLYKITDPHMGNKTLWKTTTRNSKDQLTQALIGDKITSDYNYDPATGNLSSFHSFTQDTELQDEEYQWYPIGNLYGRKKWINRDTSSFLEEQFTYDNLNRLKTVNLNNQANSIFNYDDLGNITDKPPLTDMVYGDNNSPPYAIQSANFSGNVIPDIAQDITYTIFDKIHTISEDVSTLEMTCGIDHKRISQIITIDGVENSKRLYLGGGCERITDGTGTRYINYINGPQGIFAIIEKDTDGHENLHFVLKDHLGSFNYITDKSGKLQEELSFDPWGRRRNSTDWTYVGVPSTHIFDRGFTGHEHLDDFGLINMNGRAYDPLVGRFLSTDAFVQAPDFTQSYNRYSYCLNNPLALSDPTGEFGITLAIAIGVVVNYAIQAWSGNINSTGDFFLSAGIGAASGAAGAGIGTGITAAISGSSFVAGFLGTQSALTAISTGYSSSFLSGAAIGGASGFAAGFISGTGNALMEGQNIGDALGSGLKTGAIAGAGSALLGGVLGGLDAVFGDPKNQRTFWTGGFKQYDLEPTLLASTDNSVVTSLNIPDDATVVNVDKCKVFYKSEEGIASSKSYIRPGKYIKNPVDGVATSKFTNQVFKIPNGGKVLIRMGGSVEFTNGYGFYDGLVLLDQGGWQYPQYFIAKGAYKEWKSLYNAARLWLK